jgi:phytoene dehydrogenase-like protein
LSRYDAVIVGAGHNGLVTAGYLARAGLKVLVLERRDVVGGACVTEERFPGYKVSSAAYLNSLLQQRVIQDLELERYGYFVYPKEPAYFQPFPDGRHLMFWRDMRETQKEIAKFSPHDAEVYPKYEEHLDRLAQFVEPLLMMTPPNLPPRLRDFSKLMTLGRGVWNLGGDGIAALARIMTESVAQFLDRWFESDAFKVALATDGVIGTNGGPMTPGTAYVLFHHVMGGVGGVRGLWGFVRGGMGGVTQALAASARAHGAEVRTNAGVARILTHDGNATGVALESGEEIRTRVLISNADPKRTFLHLLDPAILPVDFRREVEELRMEGCSFKINLALSELPDFKALPGVALGPQHRGTIHICPSMEYMEHAWDDAKYGCPSQNPMLECTIPTCYDASLAPPGKHLMNIFVQYAPYRLREGSWAEEKERFADRVLNILAEYAPNIRHAVLHRHVLSPADLESEFGLTGGNIFHGEMSLDQLFFLRPVPGWAQYRTPVGRLYLCGSGTHPGGGVMGAPGHNAAREILRDWPRLM